MIEILLEAERALTAGRLDQAQHLYDQAVLADPRNSIAVVGLARVALERGDEHGAHDLAERALSLDPENVAARRLSFRLEEVFEARGEPLVARATSATPAPSDTSRTAMPPTADQARPPAVGAGQPSDDGAPAPAVAAARPGLLRRLFRRG
jgi:thioredoxin-like negative regulator of GroEL